MAFEKYTSPVNNTIKPCRASAILACDAPIAVILRRGPSEWVQLIRWETGTDKLEYGQWFKGRVYERRCDLSPDGNLFIYFARKKNKVTMEDKEYTYAWTAVSKPPYFTALALWPKGNCWNGGGVFADAKMIRLNHNLKRMTAHPDHQPQGLTIVQDYGEHGEDESIYPELLRRHDWELIEEGGPWIKESRGVYKAEQPVTWQKTNKYYGLSLLMKLKGYNRNQYGDDVNLDFIVIDENIDQSYPIENATWADWDQQGRLVFIAKGLLVGQQFTPEAKQAQVIADLNPQNPSSVVTPDWAARW